MRLPILAVHLSESPPNNGSRKRASTLSAAMIAPEKVSFMWNVLVRISGITLLYICQKAQIDKNAKPILIVCFVFSFILCLYPLLLLYSTEFSFISQYVLMSFLQLQFNIIRNITNISVCLCIFFRFSLNNRVRCIFQCISCTTMLNYQI
mgnify:FL=1